jgi:hypothetical protein
MRPANRISLFSLLLLLFVEKYPFNYYIGEDLHQPRLINVLLN